MIIIVLGLPGSGKSYFAKRLAAKLNALYYSTDLVRKELNQNPSYSAAAKLSIYNVLLKKLEANTTVVLDGTFYKQSFREQFHNKANQLNELLIFIEIVANEKIIKERTSVVRENSDADFSVYKIIKAQFEPLCEPHLILESTDSNINTMLHDAITYLNLKR